MGNITATFVRSTTVRSISFCSPIFDASLRLLEVLLFWSLCTLPLEAAAFLTHWYRLFEMNDSICI